MEYDYVFANLGLTVTFKADNDSIFGQLTDKEVLSFQGMLYMTLNTFVYTKTLYAPELAILKDLLESKDAERNDDG